MPNRLPRIIEHQVLSWQVNIIKKKEAEEEEEEGDYKEKDKNEIQQVHKTGKLNPVYYR